MAIIYPSDVNPDVGKARLGVAAAAEALGVTCNCRLSTMWRIEIDNKDVPTFLELAREEAKLL
jgi:hypothetical protein